MPENVTSTSLAELLVQNVTDYAIYMLDREGRVVSRAFEEVIPGPDDRLLYWCGFVGPEGRVGGRLVGRKRRIVPIHFGSATFVELVDAPDVEEQCERFLVSVGYQGLCGVELKRDPRDGVAKLIEVNARYSLWDDIGVPDRLRELADETWQALDAIASDDSVDNQERCDQLRAAYAEQYAEAEAFAHSTVVAQRRAAAAEARREAGQSARSGADRVPHAVRAMVPPAARQMTTHGWPNRPGSDGNPADSRQRYTSPVCEFCSMVPRSC